MPSQTVIRMPSLVRQSGNMNIQRAPIPGSQTNTFAINALIRNVSGDAKVAVTSAALANQIWGQAAGKTPLTADRPPVVIPAHPSVANPVWAFDLSNDAEIDINGGVANGTDVTIGAALGTAPVVGTGYNMLVPTTGTYAGIPFLDTATVTFPAFIVTAIVDPVTDYNPRVRVKVNPAALQP